MAEVSTEPEEMSRKAEEEELDPRVKEELEILNSTSEEINKLEIELDHSRTKFRSLLTEATQRLNILYKKLGRCVTKARPYYEQLKESKKAQAEAQRAVVKFHRANGIYRAAKETVALAEERLMSMGENGEKREFDAAWQEMLNHATIKFMDSEKDKTLSEQEHSKRAAEVAEIQKKMKTMEKSMPRTIPRSRPYFELKERLEFQLQQEKLNVEDLVRALQSAKVRYRAALSTLEAISEEVHLKRRMAAMLPPRTPGVGAENLSDVGSDLPSINLDISSETSCDVISINSDDFDVISTDGSDIGDDSPRLEPRSISLPVSPLARENSSSSFNGGRKERSHDEAFQKFKMADKEAAQGARTQSVSSHKAEKPQTTTETTENGPKVDAKPPLGEITDRGSTSCEMKTHTELNGPIVCVKTQEVNQSQTVTQAGPSIESDVKTVENGLKSCVLDQATVPLESGVGQSQDHPQESSQSKPTELKSEKTEEEHIASSSK